VGGILAGKVAVVTGGSEGIGRATALALARAGAGVVLQARRAGPLAAAVADVEAAGGRALAVAGDAGDSADVERLLEAATAWGGGVDVAVANAGCGVAGGLLAADTAGWEETYRLNVLGVAHLLRRAALHMVERGAGDLVVLGSAAGRNVSAYAAFYASSKTAVAALAEGLRREVCGRGVRVSVVQPGLVRTGFQRKARYGPDFEERVRRWGELLEPDEVAAAILWILSLPPHVNVSELLVRPTGQDYP
jgi:NADP-dependent 3-hydroxy acid dehydrogenase YdfG